MSDGAYAQGPSTQPGGPRGVLGRRGRGASTGSAGPRRVLDDDRPPFYRWFAGRPAQHLLQRARPARRRRPGRPAGAASTTARSPARARTLHLRPAARAGRPLRRRAARRSASARATGSSSTCRWCPRRSSRCWPAPASARCTRWCSAGSRRPSWRPASTTPGPRSIVSASCGIEPSRVVEYKPMLDAAIERSSHVPEHCVILQREQAAAPMGERDVDWADVDAPGRRRPAPAA